MNKTSKLLSLGDIAKVSTFCLLISAFSVNVGAVNASETEKLPEVNVAQQNKKITGTVVDNYGEPVIGANVVVKGTTIGNITDVNGTFTVENYIGQNVDKLRQKLTKNNINLQVIGEGKTVVKQFPKEKTVINQNTKIIVYT